MSFLKISFAALLGFILITNSFVSGAPSDASSVIKDSKAQNKTLEIVFKRVQQCINDDKKLQKHEAGIQQLLKELNEKGFVFGTGPDIEQRPLFVNLQGCVEHVFDLLCRSGEITELVGFIHTPTPATPLCTAGSNIEALMHEAIKDDPNAKYTIAKRADILRNYLRHSGKLYVVYSDGGLEKRSQAQQKIYKEALKNFEGKLIDHPISSSLPEDMVGATYIAKNKQGRRIFFSIQASQANAANDGQVWKMWLATENNEEVSKRIQHVLATLEQDLSAL